VLSEPSPAAEADAAPPVDFKTFFLGGLFLFALLASLYAAREIVLPIVLAFVLKLVLQPVLRGFEKLHVPRAPAALLIIAVLLGSLVGVGSVLSGPASNWAEKIPGSLPKLQQRFVFLSHSLKETQKFVVNAEDMTQAAGPKVVPVALQGTRLSDRIFTGTRAFATGIFTTILVLFFLMVSGDTFLRRLVEVLPRFRDKRQAVDISQQIEQDISKYLLTITVTNAIVGIATGLVALLCGLEDPMLWGVLAFLLNYVPIIGPLIVVGILLFAGLLADIDGMALFPAGLYFLIHIIEGSFITPLVLARRFTLNSVVVILWLVFWYWMWGVPGAILAMPMLAIGKIICDRIPKLMPLGHFLEA